MLDRRSLEDAADQRAVPVVEVVRPATDEDSPRAEEVRAPGTQRRPLWRSVAAHVGVVVIAVAIFFVQGPEYVHYPASRLPAGGDSVLNAWILAWDAHALVDHAGSIWDAPIFYPTRNALTFSETLFGNLWITIPVQVLTGSSVFAANMLLFASFILCMFAVFLLVYDVTSHWMASIVAGALFSFNPFRWAHVPHLQLQPFFWAPVSLLCCHRYLAKHQRKYFFGMLVTLWIQYYASIYLGVMLATLLLIMFGLHFIGESRAHWRWSYVRETGILMLGPVGAVASAAVLLPLALPYMQTGKTWGFTRSLAESVPYSASPIGFLLPPNGFSHYHWIDSALGFPQQAWEGRVFLGATPWLLAIGCVVSALVALRGHSSRQFVWRYGAAALICMVLMLGPALALSANGPSIPLPYQIVHYIVPGGMAMRAPARFVQPLLLCLAVMSGIGLAALFRRVQARTIMTGLVAVACVLGIGWDYSADNNPGYAVTPPSEAPQVYGWLAQRASTGAVLELPMGTPGVDNYIFDYLHYQTVHWRPLVGGTSGFWPPPTAELKTRMDQCPSARCFAALQLSPTSTLVVHLNHFTAAQRDEWRNADTSPYGFEPRGEIDGALVWERTGARPALSEQLAIRQAKLVRDPGSPAIELAVQPAASDSGWVFLDSGFDDVVVTVTSRDGRRFQRALRLQPQAYILPGETGVARILDATNLPSDGASIEISGPHVQTYSESWEQL